MNTPRALLLLGLLNLTGCATLKGWFAGPEVDPSYADTAAVNLARGQAALADKNYLEAQKFFDYLKSKFPYDSAAIEAELLLGDTDFERDRFVEARDRYQNFVKLHPTHPRIDYAAFRAAVTHYKEIPSDLFVLPPSVEKDQSEVKGAHLAMREFVRGYPDSQYKAEAQKMLDDASRRLAEHELYAAAFYARRDKWPAVIGRLRIVARDFPGIGLEEKVYFGLYDAYLKINDADQAKEALRTLVAVAPGTDAAKRAQRILEKG
jgi:outer membrane protein assembly factor BamD